MSFVENRSAIPSACVDGLAVRYFVVSFGNEFQTTLLTGFLQLGLIAYLYVGIALVSECLADSVEVITLRSFFVCKRLKWSRVVASLTLMTLSFVSSNIFLSAYDAFTRGSEVGTLGLFAILGSVSFGHFFDQGACNALVPTNQVKRVYFVSTYLVSTCWVIWAYIWLYLISNVFSPGKIETWEAATTLAFLFPAVSSAYWIQQKTGFLSSMLKWLKSKLGLTKAPPNAAMTRGRLDAELLSQQHRNIKLQFDLEATLQIGLEEDEADRLIGSYLKEIARYWSSYFAQLGSNLASCFKSSICLPWYVLIFPIACLRHKLSGWFKFTCSMIATLILTILIGDLARHLSCTTRIPEAVVSFLVLALGTSVPNFLSRRLTFQTDLTADNMALNLNGSTIMSVFVGLGIPWTISAVYQSSKGSQLSIDQSSLSSSAIALLPLVIAATVILLAKRIATGGEFGGSCFIKAFSSLIFAFFWLTYVAISLVSLYKLF